MSLGLCICVCVGVCVSQVQLWRGLGYLWCTVSPGLMPKGGNFPVEHMQNVFWKRVEV